MEKTVEPSSSDDINEGSTNEKTELSEWEKRLEGIS